MTQTSIEEMRKIDSEIATVYVTRNRKIATKVMLTKHLQGAYNKTLVEQVKTRMEEVDAQIAAITEDIDRLNEAYTGWSRFFHVKHLHRSTYCSSFRWNTQILFVPELSGLTEEEAVSQYGETMCTICFKSAPTS